MSACRMQHNSCKLTSLQSMPDLHGVPVRAFMSCSAHVLTMGAAYCTICLVSLLSVVVYDATDVVAHCNMAGIRSRRMQQAPGLAVLLHEQPCIQRCY